MTEQGQENQEIIQEDGVQIQVEKEEQDKEIDDITQEGETDTENEDDLWKDTFGEEVEQNTITVEQEEAVPEHELVFDEDSIYETELEQALLRQLPIYQQNRLVVQRRIADDVKIWLSLNHRARAMKSMGPRKDALFQSARSNHWQMPWLLPIVLDKKNIYYTKEDEEQWRSGTVEEQIEQFEPKPSQPILDPRSYHLMSMEELFATRQAIEEQYKLRQIKFDVYKQRLWELTVVLESLSHPENGINGTNGVLGNRVTMEADGDGLRYWNLLEPTWAGTTFQAPLLEKVNIRDSKGNWVKTIQKTVEDGTTTQIVGIARLPTKNIVSDGKRGDLTFLWNALEGEVQNENQVAPSSSAMRIRVHITKIETGENAIITAPNHGLQNGTKIRLYQTNSYPSIDGVYGEKVQVIDADRFSVGVSLAMPGAKEGTSGVVISHAAFPWVQFQWDAAKKEWSYIPSTDEKEEENQNHPSSPAETMEQPTLLWAGADVVSQINWDTFLAASIPRPEDILRLEESTLAKLPAVGEWSDILAKYKMDWSDVPYEFWTEWYAKFLEKITLQPEPLQNQTGGQNEEMGTNNQALFEKPTLNKMNQNGLTANQKRDSIKELQQSIQANQKAIQQIQQLLDVIQKDKEKKNQTGETDVIEGEEPKECQSVFVKQYDSTKDLESEKTNKQSYPVGSLARVGQEKDVKIYEFQNGQWIFDPIRTNFFKVCALPDKALQGKSWGATMECAYMETCLPRTENILTKAKDRLESEIKEYSNVLESINNQQAPTENKNTNKNTKQNNQKPNTNQKGGDNENNQEAEGEAEENQEVEAKENEEGTKKQEEEENYDPRVLEYKKSTKDPDLLAEKLMVLFKMEGCKIGCRIVSLNTQKILGCIHEYDLYLVTHIQKKDQVIQAYQEFSGEYAVPEGGNMVCRYCGAFLRDVDADVFEGFSKASGKQRESRALWEKTDAQIIREAKKAASSAPQNPNTLATSVLDVPAIEKELPSTRDPEFRTEWVENGGALTQLDDAREMAETIHFVMNTLDVSHQLDAKGFWDSIKNVLQWSKTLPSYTAYAAMMRAELQKRGLSTAGLKEEVIRQRYQLDISGRRKIALLAQLHIWITSTFPLPIARPIGAFQSTYQGWDDEENIILFWLHMAIEFGWDPNSMRRSPSGMVPVKIGTDDFQRSIANLTPRFTALLAEFANQPNMIQRKKVFNLAQKKSQVDSSALDTEGPFSLEGPEGSMEVLERRVEGGHDVPEEWVNQWLNPSSIEDVRELRAEGLAFQNHLLASFHLDWLRAPDTQEEDTFEIQTFKTKEWAWYNWANKKAITHLNAYIQLRPYPTIGALYQPTKMNASIKLGYGAYQIKDINQTKTDEFLEVFRDVVAFKKGELREMTPNGVNMETGKTMEEIQRQNLPSHDDFMKYEERKANETKHPLLEDMVKDMKMMEVERQLLGSQANEKKGWTFRTREEWMKQPKTAWIEAAQRAWDGFMMRMTEWKVPEDRIAFQRRLANLIGKYVSAGERDYAAAQSYIRESSTTLPEDIMGEKKPGTAAARRRRAGVPAELRPDMLPPISKSAKMPSYMAGVIDSSREKDADGEGDADKKEEEAEQNLLWRPTLHEIDEVDIQDIEQRIHELQQLIFTGFKRSQRTVTSQINLFAPIAQDAYRSKEQKEFMKKMTEEKWSWLFPYADDAQRVEVIRSLTLDANPEQLESWLVRLQPRDWIRLHTVNKQERTNLEETMTSLAGVMTKEQRRDGWIGVLYGIWTELLHQLDGWLSQNYMEMVVENPQFQVHQVVADWIESVLLFYETELKFSRLPSEEERTIRSQERTASYEPSVQYQIKLAQSLQAAGRTSVDAEFDDEEEGAMAEEEAKKRQEEIEALRAEHPDWTDEKLAEEADRPDDEDVADEEGFMLGMMTGPYREEMAMGLEYGDQGDLDDLDDSFGAEEES